MPEVLVGGSGGGGRYSAVLGSGAIFTDDAADYALGDEDALAQWLPSATVGGCATLLLRGAPCAAAAAGKKAAASCPSGAVHGALDVLGRLGVRFWAPRVVAATAPRRGCRCRRRRSSSRGRWARRTARCRASRTASSTR